MIGIIAAMEDEMSILLDKLNLSVYEQVCGCRFYLGKVNETEVVLTTCGVGKVNAAIAASVMIDFYECNLIINTGIAGGITGVNTKDVIIGSKLMYHDFDVTQFGYEYGRVPGMPKVFIPSLDSVILFKKILNELKSVKDKRIKIIELKVNDESFSYNSEGGEVYKVLPLIKDMIKLKN